MAPQRPLIGAILLLVIMLVPAAVFLAVAEAHRRNWRFNTRYLLLLTTVAAIMLGVIGYLASE